MAFNDFFRIINNKRSFKLFMPISAAYFFFAFGWGIMAPIFAIYINNITGDLFLTGIILGVWGLVGIVSDIPFGVLIDKVSAKKAMQISLSAYILITITYTFATNFWELLAVRIFHSFFGALMWVSVWTYIYSHVTSKKAGRQISIFSEFYDIAATIAPLITGVIVAVSFFAPFYLLSVLCFVSFSIITLFLPETRKHDGKAKYMSLLKHEIKTIFQMGKYLLAFVFFIIIFFGISNAVWHFIPVILYMEGVAYTLIGVVIAAATLPAVLFEMPIGWAVDKFGQEKIAVLGILLSAVAVFIISLSIDIMYVIPAMFIFGLASVMMTLTINTVASRFTTKGVHGGLAGTISLFKDAGNLAGPILGGLALATISVSKTMWFISIIFLVTSVPVYLLLKRIKKVEAKINV